MSERDLLVQTMAQLARDVTATFDGPCGTNYASWARSLAIRAQAIIDEANRRSPSPSSGVDVLREKAKLADEYAACMKELRDEDGDIYGWDDTHSGNTIVGMDIGDVKDWLARYEALSPAPTTPAARGEGEG